MKVRFESFTNLLRICEKGFASVSYVFLLIIVGKEDPIGFFWLLHWYLPYIVGIVVESCQCCPILYLLIDFSFINELWW